MRIQDVMSETVVSCTEHDALTTVAKIMWDHDCGIVPVVDAEQRVVGVVTDRDVCMAAYTQGRSLHEISTGTVMSRQIACCHPWDTPLSAERQMAERRVRRLPVVDAGNKLVGIVSLGDLAHYMQTQQTTGADGMTWPAIARTFAAVSAPRHFEPPPASWSDAHAVPASYPSHPSNPRPTDDRRSRP